MRRTLWTRKSKGGGTEERAVGLVWGWVQQTYKQSISRSFVLFFFQAEDGIRDLTVTGVQTCALPICTRRSCARARHHDVERARKTDECGEADGAAVDERDPPAAIEDAHDGVLFDDAQDRKSVV